MERTVRNWNAPDRKSGRQACPPAEKSTRCLWWVIFADGDREAREREEQEGRPLLADLASCWTKSWPPLNSEEMKFGSATLKRRAFMLWMGAKNRSPPSELAFTKSCWTEN